MTMTKYHYNRGGTGRAACNKNLKLKGGQTGNRRLSDTAILNNKWHEAICKHCIRIVLKEND